MGSGKYLNNAQKKYGIENFEKEILEIFDNAEDMFQMESILVNEEFVQSEKTYNLKVGGFGGWDFINSMDDNYYHSVEHMRHMSLFGVNARKILFEDNVWVEKLKSSLRESNSNAWKNGVNIGFTGQQHSKETIDKISKSKIGHIHQCGELNSSYGTKWINNGIVQKKVKEYDLHTYFDFGWSLGKLRLICDKCNKSVSKTEYYRHKC